MSTNQDDAPPPSQTANPPRTPPQSRATAADSTISNSTPIANTLGRHRTHPTHRPNIGGRMGPHFRFKPIEPFIDQFIPGGAAPQALQNSCQAQLVAAVESSRKHSQKSIFDGNEYHLYPLLCSIAKACFDQSSSTPSLMCRDTAYWPELSEASKSGRSRSTSHLSPEEKKNPRGSEGDGRKPDLSIFFDNDATHAAADLTSEEISDPDYDVEGRRPWVSRTAFGHAVCFIEVKPEHGRSPFRPTDPDRRPNEPPEAYNSRCQGHLVSTGKQGDMSIGQIAEYASEIHLRQHRQFLFSVSVSGRTARFIRWDRAGAIVSGSINYESNLETLVTFFYRLGRMSRKELGYDPTAEPASLEEMDKLTTFAKFALGETSGLDDIRKLMVEQALADPRLWPVHTITVPHEDGTPRRFLVGKPRSGSRQPVGRGSKGYVAFDLIAQSIHFLKDAWRAVGTDIEVEMDVYKELAVAKVTRIPTVLCGGDVASSPTSVQRTTSQELFPKEQQVLPRVHYRIVFQKVYRPISSFASPWQMVNCIFDAFQAHASAWTRCGILHRDISEANIMISEEPDPASPGTLVVHGILNDWDLCKRKAALESGTPTQKTRSGTWVFLSGLLLRFPRKPYELSDDLESWAHLVNWLTLRYFEHSLLEEGGALADHLNRVYYWCNDEGLGGHHKILSFQAESLPFTIGKKGNPYQDFVEAINQVVRQHYRTVDKDEYQEKYGTPGGPTSEVSAPVLSGFVGRNDFTVDTDLFPDVEAPKTKTLKTTTAPPAGDVGESPFRSHRALGEVFIEALQLGGPLEAKASASDSRVYKADNFRFLKSLFGMESGGSQVTKRKSSESTNEVAMSNKRTKPAAPSVDSIHEED